MRNAMNHSYFEWMYQLVYDKRYTRGRSYRKLLRHLHETEFTYILPMDGNRAEDGVDLRYRFGRENGYEDGKVACCLADRPCSVLEMMVALVIRCEEHIMDDPDIGNRTSQWFWHMVSNVGLDEMIDARFETDYTDETISRFLNREYKRNGEGGLFTVKHCRHDLRTVEIWYQMCWYLDDIL